jgi:hypothetical protein
VPQDRQSARANAIARLIESFCMASVPETFQSEPTSAEQILERYLAALRDEGSANLDYDRQTLLAMYELLLAQKTRHEQRDFFASAHDDMIANRVLQLAEERIRREQDA